MTEATAKPKSVIPPVDPATQAPISTKPLVTKRTRTTMTVIGIVVVLVVLALLIGLGFLMYTSYDRSTGFENMPGTVRLRDIAFIVMAVETLVLMVLVIIVIVLLLVLIVLVYDRVIPILEQLNKTMNTVVETTHTVRGTTTFVSEKVVSPFIQVSSYAAGLARIAKGVFDLIPRSKKQVYQQSADETLSSAPTKEV